MNMAPIILFVYNRPWHTQKIVETLQKNELAKESELFVYSDAAKNEEAQKSVSDVREYLKTIDGFKKVTIIEREKNWGLADSIIDGVTKIVSEYGKIIVLEDDLVTSPYFLKFMNDALEFYENEKKVWHISGWNYPIEADGIDDVFLWRAMNCWGWATWVDRWQYYEKNIEKIIKQFDKKDIKSFNLDGSENFWNQVIENKNRKINTWAIFWYATIFKHDGLCLNPAQTFVENIGHDGSGLHCGKNEAYKCELSLCSNMDLITKLEEDGKAVQRIKTFYRFQKNPLFIRIINKLARITFGRNIIK